MHTVGLSKKNFSVPCHSSPLTKTGPPKFQPGPTRERCSTNWPLFDWTPALMTISIRVQPAYRSNRVAGGNMPDGSSAHLCVCVAARSAIYALHVLDCDVLIEKGPPFKPDSQLHRRPDLHAQPPLLQIQGTTDLMGHPVTDSLSAPATGVPRDLREPTSRFARRRELVSARWKLNKGPGEQTPLWALGSTFTVERC